MADVDAPRADARRRRGGRRGDQRGVAAPARPRRRRRRRRSRAGGRSRRRSTSSADVVVAFRDGAVVGYGDVGDQANDGTRPLARRPRRRAGRGARRARAPRARAPGAVGVVRAVADERDDDATAAARASGATRSSGRRTGWAIELEAATFAPAGRRAPPSRPRVEGVDEPLLYELARDVASRDHWGFTPTPYEEWLHWLRSIGRRRPVALVRRRGRRRRRPASPSAGRPNHGEPEPGLGLACSASCASIAGAGSARRSAHACLRGVPAARASHAPGLGVDAESTTGRRRALRARRHDASSGAGHLGATGVSTLRAKCPDCRTLTAVAFDDGYECHSCGAEFAAGLVRVPRAWGAGGEAMASAAHTALRYPEALVVEAPTLEEQSAAIARGCRDGRSSSAAAAARTSARSAASRLATSGSRSSGSTRTATSTRPRPRRRGTRGGCRCGWRSRRARSRRRTSRSSAHATSTRPRRRTSPSTGSTTTSSARSRVPTPSTSRSTSTCSSRGSCRASCRCPAGPGASEVEAILRDVASRAHVAGMGLTGLAPGADPAAAGALRGRAGL